MSKNIEEIVDSTLPEAPDFTVSSEFADGIDKARELLNQALTEGKLVVPMCRADIYGILRAECGDFLMGAERMEEISNLIYQAQFGGNK